MPQGYPSGLSGVPNYPSQAPQEDAQAFYNPAPPGAAHGHPQGKEPGPSPRRTMSSYQALSRPSELPTLIPITQFPEDGRNAGSRSVLRRRS